VSTVIQLGPVSEKGVARMTDASTIAAIAGSVSATVAAVSATMSYASSRASWAGVRDGRTQRNIDSIQASLASLGHVYQCVVELGDAQQDAADQGRLKHAKIDLEHGIITSGISLPKCQLLVTSALTPESIQAALIELHDNSQSLGTKLQTERSAI
jgi:hypothetical protein